MKRSKHPVLELTGCGSSSDFVGSIASLDSVSVRGSTSLAEPLLLRVLLVLVEDKDVVVVSIPLLFLVRRVYVRTLVDTSGAAGMTGAGA